MLNNRDIFSNFDGGYERKLGILADLARSNPTDAMTIQNTSPTTGNIFNEQAEKPEPPVYPTDLMPSVHVQNPVFNQVAALDMNKTVTHAPEDPTDSREAHEAAVSTYINMDQQIKSEFIAALKENDPEVGAGMERALGNSGPGGSPSVFTDIMKAAADPVGAGEIYAALNSLGKNLDNDRVYAAFEKTLNSLHEHTKQESKLASEGKGPAPKIDWTQLKTPKQAMDFLTRDVTKDPFMQQAADNEKIVQQMERNFTNYEDIYTQGKQTVTVDMIEAAGDDQKLKGALLATFAGGSKDKIEGFKTGFTPEEIEARLKLADVSGVSVHKVDVTAIDANVTEIAKLAYMPPKLEPANEPQYLLRASMG